MKAIVQYVYGSPDDLRFEDVEVPVPRDDEVLVRVRAASINHADVALTIGEPMVMRLALGLRRPRVRIRGRDVAGVVESVGTAVTRFQPGDEVFAESTTGSFAEYARVRERHLAHRPTNLTFEQAAAVPLAGVTALQALRDAGRVRPGQHVLVNGASGGVGTFAVQIARALGAKVTGVCSPHNLELMRTLGADHVIDHTREDFTRSDQRYDVILDNIGNHPLAACTSALVPKGVLVLSSGAGGRVLGPLGRYVRAMARSPFVGQSLRVHAARPNGDDLAELGRMIESGAVTPAVESTHPLRDTPAAIRHFLEHHARSKIVITV